MEIDEEELRKVANMEMNQIAQNKTTSELLA